MNLLGPPGYAYAQFGFNGANCGTIDSSLLQCESLLPFILLYALLES